MRMKREIFQDDSVFHTSRVLNCPKFMTPSWHECGDGRHWLIINDLLTNTEQ
jgi:hypothetical protein